MRSRLLILLLFLAPVGRAEAAPLCRDLKGLFTPCPASHAPQRPSRRSDPAPASLPAAPQAAAPSAAVIPPAVRASSSRRPPAVGRAKLCRDLKGLYTPCVG